MSLLPLAILFVLSGILGLLLWTRGIVRSNRSDMVLGISTFCFTAFAALMLWVDGYGSDGVTALCLAFGTSTLVAGSFTTPTCPVSRSGRICLGVLFIGVALLAAVFV